jgi:hypothetical protein
MHRETHRSRPSAPLLEHRRSPRDIRRRNLRDRHRLDSDRLLRCQRARIGAIPASRQGNRRLAAQAERPSNRPMPPRRTRPWWATARAARMSKRPPGGWVRRSSLRCRDAPPMRNLQSPCVQEMKTVGTQGGASAVSDVAPPLRRDRVCDRVISATLGGGSWPRRTPIFSIDYDGLACASKRRRRSAG